VGDGKMSRSGKIPEAVWWMILIYIYTLIDWSWCFYDFEICRYHQFDIFWSYVDVFIDCLHSDPFLWSIFCGKYSMQHGKDVKCWQGCWRCVFSCEGRGYLVFAICFEQLEQLFAPHEAWSLSCFLAHGAVHLWKNTSPKSDLHPKMSTTKTRVCLKLGYPQKLNGFMMSFPKMAVA
jgi:hypothetical protein